MSCYLYGEEPIGDISHSLLPENDIPQMNLDRFLEDYENRVRYCLSRTGYILERPAPTPESIALIEAVEIVSPVDLFAAELHL